MKPPSRLQHPPEVDLPEGNRPLSAPIHQSVKFEFENLEATEQFLRGQAPGFFYSRRANPTVRQLELLLAELQGGEDAVAMGSGIAAIATTFAALLRQGDHVLAFIEMYPPTHHLIKRTFARFGVTHTLLSIEDVDGVERALAGRPTRLMIFESPTNPVLKIADLERLTALARRHQTLTVLDNTFGGLHQHGGHDIDLYLHSLTKYASGHGDVMGGAVIGRADLVRRIRNELVLFGATLDPHAAWLIQRGLKTYFPRWRQQCATALQVARMLAAHPKVAAVRYPGLDSHPHHALATAQMSDFGAVVTFDIIGGAGAAARFTDSLRLFALTGSVASTESLVLPSQLLLPRYLSEEQVRISGITGGTVRLSIGLEAPEDLLADLEQALGGVE